MTRDTILGCARLASVKVEEIHKVLDGALAGADAKAALDRQVRFEREALSSKRPNISQRTWRICSTVKDILGIVK